MRHAILTTFVILSLIAAAPAYAKVPSPPLPARIARDFVTGARFYGDAVAAWMDAFLSLLGLRQRIVVEEGGACTETTLCADGTSCLRVCPLGAPCSATSRCIKTRDVGGTCTADTECKAACAALPFSEINPSAYVARCISGSCTCKPVEILPDARRVGCPTSGQPVLSCPEGTQQGCATNDAGVAFDTCLKAPEFGGTCFEDIECAAAGCPEGAAPFCDETGACKCRASEIKTIACASASECAAAGCGAGEIAACVSGACACAQAGQTASCKSTADCSTECPPGFSAACEQSRCACQRRIENVPVACKTVKECGSVSCPSTYEKTCLSDVCACTRTTQPQ